MRIIWVVSIAIAFLPLSIRAETLDVSSVEARVAAEKSLQKTSRYRGWDYLVDLLVESGLDKKKVAAVYSSSQLPRFTKISFAIEPKESPRLYSNFRKANKLALARKLLREKAKTFEHIEQTFGVDREIVAAILLIETQTGKVTGRHMVLYRLSRLASIAEPNNVVLNYHRLKKEDPEVRFEAVQDRAHQLEQMFFPEVVALFKVAEMNNISVFGVKGSYAGAFGIPQFLPSSYIRFGQDCNRDGRISLYHHEDAICSAARFLAESGSEGGTAEESYRNAIWNYNRSEAYVNAVMEVARLLGFKPEDKENPESSD